MCSFVKTFTFSPGKSKIRGHLTTTDCRPNRQSVVVKGSTHHRISKLA